MPKSASINEEEIAKFQAMADEWWSETGKFKPLHQFNPVRLSYIRETLCQHFGRDPESLTPLEGLNILDIGCGGGLLSEPLAKMGANVTGIDAGEKNIKVAALHAEQSGVKVDYRCVSVEELTSLHSSPLRSADLRDGAKASPLKGSPTGSQNPPPKSEDSTSEHSPEPTKQRSNEKFDLVLNMEVVEHVDDVEGFLSASASLVKPGGLMLVATLNRTLKSYGLAIVGAEYVLRWLPRGTHDWNKFLKPSEIEAVVGQQLTLSEIVGASYNLLSQSWSRSNDVSVNYMMLFAHTTAKK